MARPSNNGWDFIKVGETYQYKEGSFIAEVTILEDNSTDEEYSFKVQVENSNYRAPKDTFTVSHIKNFSGVYSGQSQFYENPAYRYKIGYERT